MEKHSEEKRCRHYEQLRFGPAHASMLAKARSVLATAEAAGAEAGTAPWETRGDFCAACGRMKAGLLRCTCGKKVLYCSPECQKAHKKAEHKWHCEKS